MEKIKYRAWDKASNLMIYSDQRNRKQWDIEYDFIVLKDKVVCYWEEDYDDSFGYPTTNRGEIDNIMLYTGLKDKNCKEIYTKDIVEINGHKYHIAFEIGSFMLVRCSNETDMHDEFENCWNDDVYPLAQFYWDSNSEESELMGCEVIGNIYENPELLD